MLLLHPTINGVTLDVHGSAAVAQAVKAGWVKPDKAEAEGATVPEAARD